MSVQNRNVQTRREFLIVDDEFHVARGAAMVLSQAGYECETCPNVEAALKVLEHQGADVIIADMRMPGMDGMDLLKKVHSKDPDMAVVMSVPLPAAESAKEALRGGAFDCVTKPFDNDELNAVVTRAVEMSALQRENRKLREQLDVASIAAGFIAEAPKSRQLVAMIRRVAPSRTTALIEGETGTGKELVARMLHYWSNRADGPFLAINCKALADGVVESELFGHEKGSFTGAIRDRAGCFERASGGTLFLDEIGEAGPDFQAKLLRVLEDGEVLRVGGSKPRKVDVRIVTATNRKLRNEVAAGRFRADLYFRLSVIPLRIAPLRDRREDILPLAHHFLAFHSTEAGRPLMLSPGGRGGAARPSMAGQRARTGKRYRARGRDERAGDADARGVRLRRRRLRRRPGPGRRHCPRGRNRFGGGSKYGRGIGDRFEPRAASRESGRGHAAGEPRSRRDGANQGGARRQQPETGSMQPPRSASIGRRYIG